VTKGALYDRLRLAGVVVLAGAGGYLLYKFSQSGVPAGSPGAAYQNDTELRFWIAVWTSFYQLNPKTVQAIIYQEQGPNPPNADFHIDEPDGSTSWGPMHVNDGPHGALTALGYAPPQSLAAGVKYGCQWLRKLLNAHGGDEAAAVQAWNPGQSDYSSLVLGFKASYA
jgi:hypothetical protein